MCKRRVKVLNAKSPASHGAKTPQKAYKHLEFIQLNSIKRVVDIQDTKGNICCFYMNFIFNIKLGGIPNVLLG